MPFSSDLFSIQDSLHQPVPPVAQLQQKKRSPLPQQVKEDLISLPFGKRILESPADPLQSALVAFLQFSLEAVGGEQIHIFPLAAFA